MRGENQNSITQPEVNDDLEPLKQIFAMLPVEFFEALRRGLINDTEFIIGCGICLHLKEGRGFPSRTTLMKVTGKSESTVKNAVRHLGAGGPLTEYAKEASKAADRQRSIDGRVKKKRSPVELIQLEFGGNGRESKHFFCPSHDEIPSKVAEASGRNKRGKGAEIQSKSDKSSDEPVVIDGNAYTRQDLVSAVFMKEGRLARNPTGLKATLTRCSYNGIVYKEELITGNRKDALMIKSGSLPPPLQGVTH